MTERKLVEAMVDAYQYHNPDDMPEGYDWAHEAMCAALAVAEVAIRDEVLEEAAKVVEQKQPYSKKAMAYKIRAMRGPRDPFVNTGNAEDRWIESVRLSCTACGGSGHIDDQKARTPDPLIAALEAENAALKEQLAEIAMDSMARYCGSELAIEKLREALLPFAECALEIDPKEDGEEWAKFRLLVSDYRRAGNAMPHQFTAPKGE